MGTKKLKANTDVDQACQEIENLPWAIACFYEGIW